MKHSKREPAQVTQNVTAMRQNFPETRHRASAQRDAPTRRRWNKYSTSVGGGVEGLSSTDLLKIEGQRRIPNFQSAVERKCNTNTISPGQSARSGGRGGIPGVVQRPLKLSSFAARMRAFVFLPSACCGRC